VKRSANPDLSSSCQQLILWDNAAATVIIGAIQTTIHCILLCLLLSYLVLSSSVVLLLLLLLLLLLSIQCPWISISYQYTINTFCQETSPSIHLGFFPSGSLGLHWLPWEWMVSSSRRNPQALHGQGTDPERVCFCSRGGKIQAKQRIYYLHLGPRSPIPPHAELLLHQRLKQQPRKRRRGKKSQGDGICKTEKQQGGGLGCVGKITPPPDCLLGVYISQGIGRQKKLRCN